MVNLSFSSVITFLSILAAIIYLFGAVYSITIKPRNPKSILFLFLNLALAVWSFAYTLFFNSPDKEFAVGCYRFAAFGYCTYYAFAIHLTFLFYIKNSVLISYMTRFFYFSCIPFIVLFFIDDLDMFTFYKADGIWKYSFNFLDLWYLMYLLISLLPLAVLLYPCLRFIKKNTSLKAKKKYIIIFCTQLISLAAGVFTNIISPAAGLLKIPPMAHILVLVYILGLSYLVRSHSLISITPAIAAGQILSKVADMIVLTDTDGNITEVNESLKNLLGYTEKDLLGNKIGLLFPNADLLKPHFVLNNNADINISGFNILTRFNTSIPVRLSISTIFDDNFAFIGNVYIFQDMRLVVQLKSEITKKDMLAESLLKKNEQLEELDKLKSDFLCNVSHELRTPLNLLLSSLKLSLLKLGNSEQPLDPQQIYKLFEVMNQNCCRLTKVINNIIDITKIDAGYFELNLSNYNIVNVVEEITLTTAAYTKNKGINFVFDTEVEELMLACDAERIQRVLLNLFSNSVKYTQPGGEIFVNMSIKENFVQIAVKDTGLGISQDKQQLIFERFIQVDRSLTRLQEGSGIGLSLVKSLVELHKGTISVESELNNGSTFIVSLPIYILGEKDVRKVPNFEALQNTLEKIGIEFADVSM